MVIMMLFPCCALCVFVRIPSLFPAEMLPPHTPQLRLMDLTNMWPTGAFTYRTYRKRLCSRETRVARDEDPNRHICQQGYSEALGSGTKRLPTNLRQAPRHHLLLWPCVHNHITYNTVLPRRPGSSPNLPILARLLLNRDKLEDLVPDVSWSANCKNSSPVLKPDVCWRFYSEISSETWQFCSAIPFILYCKKKNTQIIMLRLILHILKWKHSSTNYFLILFI